MGSTSSKFRKALQTGEEVEAMQLYLKNPDIKRNLDPNYSYGENYSNNTFLHYACLYAMKPFVRDFMSEGANMNQKNSLSQTPIHYVCMSDRTQDPVIDKLRAECLSMMLCSCKADDIDEESSDLGVKDHKNNTALHYAASSGLYQCVQILVANGVPLYEENDDNQTACDCAIQGNFSEIASFLESKMVFSDAVTDSREAEVHLRLAQEEMQPHRGLCAQDLQEAKDQLLVETADMLMVPLFTAEALLRDYEWSREKLVEAWMNDAKAACEKAGVKLPEGYTDGDIDTFTFRHEDRTASPKTSEHCLICADEIDELLALSCGHATCYNCWERYLNIKIKEGDAHNIQCPALKCNTLVPLETIEKLVSREMASRYLLFDIKAFVESNPNIKWCPAQGCGRAVRLPPSASPLVDPARTLARRRREETPCLMVDCGSAHYFCWHCLQEVHEPCTCELWDKWIKKIAEMLPKIPTLKEKEVLDECPETEKVANTLWLVTNSKPCPNCKSPIQKTEGCNHMKCSKCKHEFCWVCLELWKKHSSVTGGYFRCNRYEIIRKLNIDCVDSIKNASEKNMSIQKLNYFLHYYSRFKNHENSFKLEEPLLGAAKEKMTALAMSALENDTSLDGVDTSFVEDAVRELLKARRVLKASYAYGYFLDGSKEKKTIFEFMQTEVEEVTENLSQMVARPYLRTPRSKIIQTTAFLRNKRQTFLLALSRGLIPDEELPERFVSKLESLTRVPTSSDDESDEGEDNYNEIRRVIESSIREQLAGRPFSDNNSPDSSPSCRPEGLMGLCSRIGCLNPRLNRQYTGQLSSYCCYDCLRIDKRNKRLRKKKQEKRRREAERQAAMPVANFEDTQLDLDLMRAIELSLDKPSCSSKRQLTRQHSSSSSSSASSEENHAQQETARNLVEEENTSLQKALELSYGILVKEPTLESSSRQDQDLDLMKAIQLSLEGEGSTATAPQSSLDTETTSTCIPLPPDDNESSSGYQNDPTTKHVSDNNK
ncbi:ankyrin repeat and IBR domain-containing protein 1-like [Actinia tenebrosa]|uniref:RBR-type E3 ubiquitin transferase n=1 Tax=Actinia tenebrosa TaxID=6105 RepID=A0A6P8I476_ACTTE|nr:ankyrin repeat and IBR domain-containing protein 1-like [Actinia tenebrosa]